MRLTGKTILLWPLSKLYGAVVSIRNLLFDRGLLPQQDFAPFILTVGNLAAGGTGKTPHVMALAEALRHDFSVAVLSRGYGRRTNGFRWVNEHDDPLDCGDEPLEIKQKFPDLPLAVDGNRRRALQRMVNELQPPPDIVLLDDGFQHRYVQADFRLLLTRFDRLFVRDHLLPLGRLRESTRAVRRASAVCVTYAPGHADENKLRKELKLDPGIPLWISHAEYRFASYGYPDQKDHILLVSSIAHPNKLKESLAATHPLIRPMVFSDHHRYTDHDIQRIIRTFNTLPEGQRWVVTTGKDRVKLRRFNELESIPIVVWEPRIRLAQSHLEELKEHVRRYHQKN